MINLQDFITESLTQIAEGVKAAQAKVAQSGAMINPEEMIIESGMPFWHGERSGYSPVGQIIEFDVAVVAVSRQYMADNFPTAHA